MSRSSTTNSPGVSFADRRPMCIGRSMYFVPSRSARSRRLGPRSTVNTVTRMRRDDGDDDGQQAQQDTAEAALARRRLRRAPASVPAVSGACVLVHCVYSITTSTRPASTDVPGVTLTSLTVPAFGERSSFSIFIASTTTTP